MSNTGTNGTTGGNTNSPVVNKEKKRRDYFFTWNNPDISGEQLAQNLEELCEKFIFQYERGEEGTPHFQGIIKFKNAHSFSSVKKMFPKWHTEKPRKEKNCVNYCQKSETQIEGPWAKGFRIISRPRIISVLRDWQKMLLDIVDNDDSDRSIHWVVDFSGNNGKTALAKYLCVTRGALYVTGKSADVKFGVAEHLEKNDCKLVIFDLSRSQENYVSYQAIEEIKNGIFFNTKYESKMVIFDSPKIIVFANFSPDLHALSRDRWFIWNLDNGELKQDTTTHLDCILE